MNSTKQVPDYQHIQEGVTWLGGTTHELQRQHIPGYAGHVHGLHAENVYGRNFARVTAECLNSRHPTGITIDNDEKYTTSYKNQFDQPDQRKNKFVTTAENLLGKLTIQEQAINMSISEQHQRHPQNIKEIAPLDRLPVPGYMGHRPVFRPPIKEIQPTAPCAPVQLQERKTVEKMLETGNFDKKAIEKMMKQEPVVGYAGFLKGVKAENQYGSSYKETARKSILK